MYKANDEDGDQYLLKSATVDVAWSPGTNIADCRDSYRTQHFRHSAPQIDCTCGFYAVYEPHHIPHYNGCEIYAVIEASGKIVLGTRGFRAQKARIVAATLVPLQVSRYGGSYTHEILNGIARTYNISTFTSYDDMIAAYPPEDVSELVPKEKSTQRQYSIQPKIDPITYTTNTTTTTTTVYISSAPYTVMEVNGVRRLMPSVNFNWYWA